MSCLLRLDNEPKPAPYVFHSLCGKIKEITMSANDYTNDVADFRNLPLHKLADELEESDAKYIRGLAEHLNLPTRYDEGNLKTAGVLVAAIYEHFRVERA